MNQNLNLVRIYDINEQELDLGSLGLIGLRLNIPSPSYETTSQKVDGQSGAIVMDRVLQERKLSIDFVSRATDYNDSLALRDRLYGLLGNGRFFYVSEVEQPIKRWKVYLDEWTPERFDRKTHVFNIPLTCPSGMSESISVINRIFNTTSFRFKNEGNEPINPRFHSQTEIEFSGASSGLIIRNLTTWDEWSWNGNTVAGDKLLLKGIRSLKNGESIFGQTNKKLIMFNPGWNEFEILGTTGDFELTIRTRFYFL